jgi:hypothetical protein
VSILPQTLRNLLTNLLCGETKEEREVSPRISNKVTLRYEIIVPATGGGGSNLN